MLNKEQIEALRLSLDMADEDSLRVLARTLLTEIEVRDLKMSHANATIAAAEEEIAKLRDQVAYKDLVIESLNKHLTETNDELFSTYYALDKERQAARRAKERLCLIELQSSYKIDGGKL